jgi:hypothetical protein
MNRPLQRPSPVVSALPLLSALPPVQGLSTGLFGRGGPQPHHSLLIKVILGSARMHSVLRRGDVGLSGRCGGLGFSWKRVAMTGMTHYGTPDSSVFGRCRFLGGHRG